MFLEQAYAEKKSIVADWADQALFASIEGSNRWIFQDMCAERPQNQRHKVIG